MRAWAATTARAERFGPHFDSVVSDLYRYDHFPKALSVSPHFLRSLQVQPAIMCAVAAQLELVAGTRAFTLESSSQCLLGIDGPLLHLHLGTAHFENFLNISCRFLGLLTGAPTSLFRLSLNSFIFPLQTEPFVADTAPRPPHKSSKWCREMLVGHFQKPLRYFVHRETWFLGCYPGDYSAVGRSFLRLFATF